MLSPDRRPRRRALVDFWQADGAGEYDNAGPGGRGHQFTDAQGRFRLTTVLPGLYAEAIAKVPQPPEQVRPPRRRERGGFALRAAGAPVAAR